MGRPAGNWLSHLEAHEDNATTPAKVEAGLIDARYARNCDEWWADHKGPDGSWHTKAVDNYKTAAATFWEAYEEETTPHIYNALSMAAKAASARAAELEDDAAPGKDAVNDDDECDCDACRAARQVSCDCAACRNRCPVHGHQG